VVSFMHRQLTPGERVPGTHRIGGWVDPRASLDDSEKRKFLTVPGLELRRLDRPARSQSLCLVPIGLLLNSCKELKYEETNVFQFLLLKSDSKFPCKALFFVRTEK
jgi:hypothetical protein